MELVKQIHILCALITGLGFLIRGLLALRQSTHLNNRFVKSAPHAIDTLLLVSGLTMVLTWHYYPTSHPWLMAKIAALLVYIGFGLLMLRFGNTQRKRLIGFTGGLATYLYMLGAAHNKSILSYLTMTS